ncbi:MAG: hypothetical protein FJZ38_19695 [Candidatus Rokubacteria bacterium]|nr:hypothetical protein [Candidatus Rokubacteria bacterium]
MARLPVFLLLVYGVTFAARVLGVGPPAFDDHPGQLARLWHVLGEGPAPWAWNDGWWAGYPELQFYPPGWFYVAAALSRLTFGALSAPASYQTLLWLTYLAPGVTAFLLLRRVFRDRADAQWLALPGAVVVLAFAGDPAGGTASGVEGGVRIGMVGARLAWALLPLLALTMMGWLERGGRFPHAAVVLLAATMLTHPTHTPAALAIVAAAVTIAPAPRRALGSAALGVVIALALVAFWLLPLIWHLGETRALAWGRLSLATLATPLAAVLIALALVARRHPWSRLILHALGLSVLAVLVDALVAEPLGLRFLPSDRVADGAWMTLLLAAGVGAGVMIAALGPRVPATVASLGVVAALIAFSLPGETLTLWPRAAEWPSHASVVRGLRMEDLWRLVRAAPPGRVLFVRSGVPLVYGTAWYRPHTHITALTPVVTGRDIIGGTFTHGSPIAALVYRGDIGRAPITRLAEQLDGESLFGRPLDRLDRATFDTHAQRLHVSAVVVLEDDLPHVRFLSDHPRYVRVPVPPFLLFVSADRRRMARRLDDGSRELAADDAGYAWITTGIAYYPLWRAERDGRAVPARRGELGDLEIQPGPGPARVRLVYGAGGIELVALLITAAGVGALGWSASRRRVAGAQAQGGAERI